MEKRITLKSHLEVIKLSHRTARKFDYKYTVTVDTIHTMTGLDVYIWNEGGDIVESFAGTPEECISFLKDILENGIKNETK